MELFLHLFLCVILFSFSLQLETVKIGAIFFHYDNDLLLAFDAAIKDINELERDVILEPLKHFISEDDSLVLQEITCELIENGAAAIFGPSSKAASDIVEEICNTNAIPHMQYDWRDHQTQEYMQEHPMTVNLAPAPILISQSYWDILRHSDFDWKSFTIVYESSSNLALLQHLLGWKQFQKTGLKIKKFHRNDDYRVLWKYISNSREKFVVLECPTDILTEVVNASIYFNMTDAFNNFFLTNLDAHVSGIDALYSRKFLATIYAVRMRPYVPPLIHHEADVFEDVEKEQIVQLRSQLLYDALVLYYNALRKIVKDLRYEEPKLRCGYNSWSSGPDLIEGMKWLSYKNVSPPFKTQRVHLNEFGQRDDFNLEVYNPLIDRIAYVWNQKYNLVSYDAITENATKKATNRRTEQKEDFSQKRLRYTVATRVGEPYFMWREEPEGVHYEGNERFEGYAVDLIYKLAEECKFDFIFEPVGDNKYGSYNPVTDEWDGIIRQLIDNNAQIGICDLTITQARRAVVDFTVPFMQLGVSILHYKPPPPPKNFFGFLKPFSLDVWIYLLVALLVSSLVLVLTSRIERSEWTFTNETNDGGIIVENIWHLNNTLWLNLGSLLCQGCDLLPRGLSTRLFTASWWIFALLISQTYIAKLAAFITASKMEGSIRNLHDLVDQNKVQFGTVKGGSTYFFFSESNESDYRLAWNKMVAMKPDAFTTSNKEGVDRVVRSKGRYAFLMETTNLHYYVERDCRLTTIGSPFSEKHYGIAVPLNAPFRSNLSVGILKLSEKGVLYTLKNKWFNSNQSCENTQGTSDDGADSSQYNMDSLGGLFLVLVAGTLFAILVGITEFFWHAHRISIKENVSFRQVVKYEFLFAMQFWKTQKPLRTYIRSRGSTSTGYCSGEVRSMSVASTARKKKTKRKCC